jgi:hypothetical protein
MTTPLLRRRSKVPVGREVDGLVARELVRQARDAGVALTAASIGSHRVV